jgi:hypothetical protein
LKDDEAEEVKDKANLLTIKLNSNTMMAACRKQIKLKIFKIPVLKKFSLWLEGQVSSTGL